MPGRDWNGCSQIYCSTGEAPFASPDLLVAVAARAHYSWARYSTDWRRSCSNYAPPLSIPSQNERSGPGQGIFSLLPFGGMHRQTPQPDPLSGHEHKYGDAGGEGFFVQARREHRAYPQ